MIEGIKVIGNLRPDDRRKGSNVPRDQHIVISVGGVSAAITAKYNQHAFNIMDNEVLGWTRGEQGNIVDYHAVDVANTVTSAKRENTQNYVLTTADTVERERVQPYGAGIPTIMYDENGLRQIDNEYRIRRLTPRECFRLMGVGEPEIDKLLASGISDTQLYHLAGNSIVVNCLASIWRQLFVGNSNKYQQTELF